MDRTVMTCGIWLAFLLVVFFALIFSTFTDSAIPIYVILAALFAASFAVGIQRGQMWLERFAEWNERRGPGQVKLPTTFAGLYKMIFIYCGVSFCVLFVIVFCGKAVLTGIPGTGAEFLHTAKIAVIISVPLAVLAFCATVFSHE